MANAVATITASKAGPKANRNTSGQGAGACGRWFAAGDAVASEELQELRKGAEVSSEYGSGMRPSFRSRPIERRGSPCYSYSDLYNQITAAPSRWHRAHGLSTAVERPSFFESRK